MSALAITPHVALAARSRARALAVGPLDPPPVVAVLCAPRCARAAAAAVALALARLRRCPVALAAAVGVDGATPVLASPVPAARRAVARLHERGERAAASGRLVWLGDREPAWAETETDGPGATAAASAALGRASGIVRAPAALAVPLARTAALDRVLRWHDGIVIVRGDAAERAMVDRVRRSLAALDRPVAEMPSMPRLVATAATLGIAAPAVAVQAVTELSLGGPPRGGRA